MRIKNFLFLLAFFGIYLLALSAADVYQHDNPFAGHTEFDRFLTEHWTQGKITPANEATDSVIVRRIYIDLVGRVPRLEETLDYLRSNDLAKYDILLKKLLDSEEHAMFWTMRLGDELRIKSEFPINLWPNATFLYSKALFDFWHNNESYDCFAEKLILACGSNFRSGEANFFRALPVKDANHIAEAAVLFFLGKRMEELSVQEKNFYTECFSEVRYKSTKEWKEEIVYSAVYGKDDPRLRFLSHIRSHSEFSETMIRRIWRYLFGHDKIDKEIVSCLSNRFRENGYDVKKLVSEICTSAAYRVGPFADGDYAQNIKSAAVYPVRRLDAEVLADSIAQITGTINQYASVIPEPFSFYNTRAAALPDGSITSSFLILFGRPSRDTGFVGERKNEITAKQRLQLFNSIALYQRIQRFLMTNIKDNKDKIGTLYLLFYSRYPTEEERKIAVKLRKNDTKINMTLAWILLNSREFLYQH